MCAENQISVIFNHLGSEKKLHFGENLNNVIYRFKGWCLLFRYIAGPVFSYKLRYIVGFWLVEMGDGHLDQSEAYDIS